MDRAGSPVPPLPFDPPFSPLLREHKDPTSTDGVLLGPQGTTATLEYVVRSSGDWLSCMSPQSFPVESWMLSYVFGGPWLICISSHTVTMGGLVVICGSGVPSN